MIAGELDRSVREIERKISVSPSITFVAFARQIGLLLSSGHADTRGILIFALLRNILQRLDILL